MRRLGSIPLRFVGGPSSFLASNASQVKFLGPAFSAKRWSSFQPDATLTEIQKLQGAEEFTKKALTHAILQYKGLDFDGTYYTNFGPKKIAQHIHGFMIASQQQTAMGTALAFDVEGEKEAFYFSSGAHKEKIKTMIQIDHYIAARRHLLETHGLSIRCYRSDKDVNLVIYTVKFNHFSEDGIKAVEDGKPLTFEQAASPDFLKRRGEDAIDRYYRIFNESTDAIRPVCLVEPESSKPGVHVLMLGVRDNRVSYLEFLTSLVEQLKMNATDSITSEIIVEKSFCETFANRMQVHTLYVRGATEEQLLSVGSHVGLMPNRPEHVFTKLFHNEALCTQEVLYGFCACYFGFQFTPPDTDDIFTGLCRVLRHDVISVRRLNMLRNNMFQEILSERYIAHLLSEHIDLFHGLFQDFDLCTQEHACAISDKGSVKGQKATPRQLRWDSLLGQAERRFSRSPRDLAVIRTLLTFNRAVRATNFFCQDTAATSFKLDPTVFLPELGYLRIPHTIYQIAGSHFHGFHVRFHDIARGGVRMLLPADETDFQVKRKSLFQECYNLAYTQTLKNKDIAESGSKGILLVSSHFKGTQRDPTRNRAIYLQYMSGFLDIMQKIPGTRFIQKGDEPIKDELLFFGPDENTAGSLPSAAAAMARDRGFKFAQSLTTGKSPQDGGIPHDIYGMTTRSIFGYQRALHAKLGLDPSKLTKFQTGGPAGDLGSNEIKLSRERYVGMCDLGGCVYDPNGINSTELHRLADTRQQLDAFDTSKLSSEGFFVPFQKDLDLTLPDGTHVQDGMLFLSDFHLSKYAAADMFLPCGGRPNSVNLENVQKLINVPGITSDQMLDGSAKTDKVKFKYIVEGANLFFSQDARIALEKTGVTLFKDASANKGGVTSSAYEIFAGLALSLEEHKDLMCAKPDGTLHDFYKQYVSEIQERISANAEAEFNAVWNDARAGFGEGTHTLVSDALSRKIIEVYEFILVSSLIQNEKLMRYILTNYIPPVLVNHVGMDGILKRVPRSYLEAVFAKRVARNYVFGVGLRGSEFSFYDFMGKLECEADETMCRVY